MDLVCLFISMMSDSDNEVTPSQMSDSDNDVKLSLTPEENSTRANPVTITNNVLPEKSKIHYEKVYGQFMEWKTGNDTDSFSEDTFIKYFDELALHKKASSLWSYYSMLKATVNIKHQIDISKYVKLTALLKRKSKGYSGKKAKVFSSEQIKKFLDEAPDEIYLLTKVTVIFGIMGGCRRQELHQLQYSDVTNLGSHIIVNLPNTTKTKKPRSFFITGTYLTIVQKYIDLRPLNCTNKFFFLNYHMFQCTYQNVGINKMGAMGKSVAAYLDLPNPELYTGHCFRRSSATLLVDADGDILDLKKQCKKTLTVTPSEVDKSI